jgi:antitoxin HigA-1
MTLWAATAIHPNTRFGVADRRSVTATTALILARVFGNSPDFWLNVHRRNDLREAMNKPRERARIERAKLIHAAA